MQWWRECCVATSGDRPSITLGGVRLARGPSALAPSIRAWSIALILWRLSTRMTLGEPLRFGVAGREQVCLRIQLQMFTDDRLSLRSEINNAVVAAMLRFVSRRSVRPNFCGR